MHLYLQQLSNNRWNLLVRGKNGEARADAFVDLRLQHRWITSENEAFKTSLRSDA